MHAFFVALPIPFPIAFSYTLSRCPMHFPLASFALPWLSWAFLPFPIFLPLSVGKPRLSANEVRLGPLRSFLFVLVVWTLGFGFHFLVGLLLLCVFHCSHCACMFGQLTFGVVFYIVRF